MNKETVLSVEPKTELVSTKDVGILVNDNNRLSQNSVRKNKITMNTESVSSIEQKMEKVITTEVVALENDDQSSNNSDNALIRVVTSSEEVSSADTKSVESLDSTVSPTGSSLSEKKFWSIEDFEEIINKNNFPQDTPLVHKGIKIDL